MASLSGIYFIRRPYMNEKQFQMLLTALSNKNFGDFASSMQNQAQQNIVQASEQPKKKSTLGKILSGATKILDVAAPIASFIPGVSGVANLYTTMRNSGTLNDDEWFSEYKGAGATFNEWIKCTIQDDSIAKLMKINPLAAIAYIPSGINFSDKFWDNYMPDMLAYIRMKTDNVLVSDPTQYRVAIKGAIQLYELYYHGKALLELSAHQPLNIPNLTGAIELIKPVNYAQFGGLVKSLEDYIKSSVRLPHALTEYLRWRFGTVFESENTGKPGLIIYSPNIYTEATTEAVTPVIAATTISQYETLIETVKSMYLGAGRAAADIKLAYEDHFVRYDVEARHYDAKEFNLRCNFSSTENSALARINGTPILLDSRLDMNAAIQAVTISTRALGKAAREDVSCPFVTNDPVVYFYLTSEDATAYAKFIMLTGAQQSYVKYKAGWNRFVWRSNFDEASSLDKGGSFEYYIGEPSSKLTGYDAFVADFHDRIAYALVQSLQMHNRPNYKYYGIYDGTTEVYACTVLATPLSYDIATVTDQTLANINRTAFRNLVRGTYTKATKLNERKEVVEGVQEITEAVVDSTPKPSTPSK